MQNLGAAPHSLTETRDFRLTLTTSLLRTVSLDWLPLTYKGKGCVCKMLRLKKFLFQTLYRTKNSKKAA